MSFVFVALEDFMHVLRASEHRYSVAVVGGLLFAGGCLAPGELADEEAFPLRSSGASTGGNSAAGGTGAFGKDAGSLPPVSLDAETVGCPQACGILESRCAGLGCHAPESPAAGLDLGSSGLVERLGGSAASTPACADESFLVAGSPDDSLIYTKLLRPASCGLGMPIGDPLPADEVECIRRFTEAPSCDAEPPAGGGGASSVPDGSAPPMGSGGSGGEGTGGSQNMEATQTIWQEAEASELVAPMAVFDDAEASGGKFISVPAGPVKNDAPDATTEGTARFDFSIQEPDTYAIFGRVFATTEDDDSFWLRVDEGAWQQWNNLEKGAWVWDDVHDSASADGDVRVTFELAAGAHSITVMYREAGAQLDKLAVTNDAALAPTGTGQ